jgi:hypothetical protein
VNWYSLQELVVAKPAACGVELAHNNLLVGLFREGFVGNCTNLRALFLENNPFLRSFAFLLFEVCGTVTHLSPTLA